MKLFKKIVDERQELELLRIERIGFWVLFWGLLIVLHVQLFADGFNFRQIAGEFILLMVGAIVVLIACLKKGLWSYSTKPTVKSNSLYSLAGAIIFSFISIALQYRNLPANENGLIGKLLPTFIVQTVILFAACFILLSICGAVTNKRKAKLEAKFDD